MINSNDYAPPATGNDLLRRQDELDALRLLIAQRRLYSRAKLWLSARWFGMLVIGLAAPILAVIWPQSGVIVGSIAGGWLFLGRTILMHLQRHYSEQAAAVQEQFDFYVYGMPPGTARPKLPSIEEISLVAGPGSTIIGTASREKLLGWYVVPESLPGAVAVAIAQRSNASYSYRLLRSTGIIWAIVSALWAILLISLCIFAGLSLETFLLGVALPMLPAFLDVAEYIVGVLRSSTDRKALYEDIESRVRDTEEPITGQSLRVWQESLYELRRDAPTVPDFIYKMRRKKNDDAMLTAATHLSQQSQTENE